MCGKPFELYCEAGKIELRWVYVGVIQKATGSGLETVYSVSSSRGQRGRGDNGDDVFDLDE